MHSTGTTMYQYEVYNSTYPYGRYTTVRIVVAYVEYSYPLGEYRYGTGYGTGYGTVPYRTVVPVFRYGEEVPRIFYVPTVRTGGTFRAAGGVHVCCMQVALFIFYFIIIGQGPSIATRRVAFCVA